MKAGGSALGADAQEIFGKYPTRFQTESDKSGVLKRNRASSSFLGLICPRMKANWKIVETGR